MRTDKLPAYVFFIKERFDYHYPDRQIKLFEIYRVLKFFTQWIKEELMKENMVSLLGIGKLHVAHRYNYRLKRKRRYVKFAVSPNVLLRVRQHFEDLTESEKKTLAQKDEFLKPKLDLQSYKDNLYASVPNSSGTDD